MQRGSIWHPWQKGIGGNAFGSPGDYKKKIEFQRQSLSIARETGNEGSEGKYYVSVITDEQSSFISSPFVRIAKEIGEKG